MNQPTVIRVSVNEWLASFKIDEGAPSLLKGELRPPPIQFEGRGKTEQEAVKNLNMAVMAFQTGGKIH